MLLLHNFAVISTDWGLIRKSASRLIRSPLFAWKWRHTAFAGVQGLSVHARSERRSRLNIERQFSETSAQTATDSIRNDRWLETISSWLTSTLLLLSKEIHTSPRELVILQSICSAKTAKTIWLTYMFEVSVCSMMPHVSDMERQVIQYNPLNFSTELMLTEQERVFSKLANSVLLLDSDNIAQLITLIRMLLVFHSPKFASIYSFRKA